MSWRYMSRLSMAVGGAAVVAGAVIHGLFRDSRVLEDRQWMIVGTEIGVVGLFVLLGGAALAQLGDRERSGDP